MPGLLYGEVINAPECASSSLMTLYIDSTALQLADLHTIQGNRHQLEY